MRRAAVLRLCRFIVVALLAAATSSLRAAEPVFTRQEDVIYGRKYGMALTLDVFTPKDDANGAAVISRHPRRTRLLSVGLRAGTRRTLKPKP